MYIGLAEAAAAESRAAEAAGVAPWLCALDTLYTGLCTRVEVDCRCVRRWHLTSVSSMWKRKKCTHKTCKTDVRS